MLTIEMASDQMIVARKIIIEKHDGIDILWSRRIVQTARSYKSNLELIGIVGKADARNALEIMALELLPGSEVILKSEGQDAQEAFNSVFQLLIV